MDNVDNIDMYQAVIDASKSDVEKNSLFSNIVNSVSYLFYLSPLGYVNPVKHHNAIQLWNDRDKINQQV